MRHDLLANLSHLHLPLVALPLFRTLNNNKHVLLCFNNSGWMQSEFICYHEYIEQTNVIFWKYYGNIKTLCGIYVGISVDIGLDNGTACSQVDIETPIRCLASRIVTRTFSSTYINWVVGIMGLVSALKILVRHFTMQRNLLLLILKCLLRCQW